MVINVPKSFHLNVKIYMKIGYQIRELTHLEFRSSIIRKLIILSYSFIMFFMVGCCCYKWDFESAGETHQSKNQLDQVINTQHVVIIKGQVNYQRGVTFSDSLMLDDAIKRCSGFTQFADLENIQITRGEEKIHYNLAEDYKISEIKLEPNDIVEIPFNNPDS